MPEMKRRFNVCILDQRWFFIQNGRFYISERKNETAEPIDVNTEMIMFGK